MGLLALPEDPNLLFAAHIFQEDVLVSTLASRRAAQSQGLSWRVSVSPPTSSLDMYGVRAVLAAKPRAAMMTVTMRDLPIASEPTPVVGFIDPFMTPRALEYHVKSKRALLEVRISLKCVVAQV